MEHYRCFLMNAAGKFIGSVEIEAGSEEEAYRSARNTCRRNPSYVGFELWQGPRLVVSRPNLLSDPQPR